MIAKDVKLGKNVKIYHPHLSNIYGCEIGDNCKIGAFVEIKRGSKIGSNVKVQPYTIMGEGTTIEDGVYIGPHTTFVNDKYPRAADDKGNLLPPNVGGAEPILVKAGASIGANAVIMGGVTIGKGALVGAGSVVTKDVPDGAVVAGNPARILRKK